LSPRVFIDFWRSALVRSCHTRIADIVSGVIFLSCVDVLKPVLVVCEDRQRSDCVCTLARNKKHWDTIVTYQALAHLIPSIDAAIVSTPETHTHLRKALTYRGTTIKFPDAWITNTKVNALTALP
jgi:hypothetical protein